MYTVLKIISISLLFLSSLHLVSPRSGVSIVYSPLNTKLLFHLILFLPEPIRLFVFVGSMSAVCMSLYNVWTHLMSLWIYSMWCQTAVIQRHTACLCTGGIVYCCSMWITASFKGIFLLHWSISGLLYNSLNHYRVSIFFFYTL